MTTEIFISAIEEQVRGKVLISVLIPPTVSDRITLGVHRALTLSHPTPARVVTAIVRPGAITGPLTMDLLFRRLVYGL